MIDRFTGRYRFLSNFYPCVVTLDDYPYPSVEHAYQAAKFAPADREPFRDIELRAGVAKRMGRGKGVAGWYDRSLLVMEDLLHQKFREPKLRALLLATGNAELIEGNNWHDVFFGFCYCPRCNRGDNFLGQLLMSVRERVKKGQDL